MGRLWIYPDDYEPSAVNPLGTLEQQAKWHIRAQIAARHIKLVDLSRLTGLSKSGLTHMLSSRRPMTINSAQLLLEAMDRTFDLRVVMRARARATYDQLEAEAKDLTAGRERPD